MGHGKASFHSGKSKSPYCPFKNFCIFLNGETPEAILTDRDYLRNCVDELEFSMDIANWQTVKLQARVKELEDDKSKLEKDLSEALQAPFKKHKKKEAPKITNLIYLNFFKLTRMPRNGGSTMTKMHIAAEYIP